MERRQRDVWLSMQGYHRHQLRPKITWYGYEGREFKGQSDNYTIDHYRTKGFVLQRKFLDPDQWQYLEYVIEDANITRLPRLATAIVALLHGRDSWKGTASELRKVLGSGEFKVNDNVTPARLSEALAWPEMIEALESKGISVERTRTSSSRTISLVKM